MCRLTNYLNDLSLETGENLFTNNQYENYRFLDDSYPAAAAAGAEHNDDDDDDAEYDDDDDDEEEEYDDYYDNIEDILLDEIELQYLYGNNHLEQNDDDDAEEYDDDDEEEYDDDDEGEYDDDYYDNIEDILLDQIELQYLYGNNHLQQHDDEADDVK